MVIAYCTNCGAQNPQGARFCNNCSAPLDLRATVPPGAAPPPQPYAPQQPRGSQMCESRPKQEEECMGQTRIPGFVVFAIIILMVGIFALIQWVVERTYGTTYSAVVWPIFGIAVALVLIGVWALTRPRVR